MDSRPHYSSFEGRISSISKKHGIVQAKMVGLNGGSVVLAKIDPGLENIEDAAKGRERVLCIFERHPDFEELLVVGAVFVVPKGETRKSLLAEVKLLEEGTISLSEFLEKAEALYPQFYGNRRIS